MKPISIAAAAIVSIALAFPVQAQSERIGPFVIVDDAPGLVILAGEITSQTPLEFKTALLRRPDATMVVLSSPGGNVTAGLLLADEVHLRGLNTFIPSDTGCYSACAYVFLGGKARLAEGELGVHQFSGPDGDMDVAQVTVASMLEIMESFDVAQGVISRMLRTGAEDIHVFTRKEIAEFSINREPEVALAQTLPLRTLPEDVFQYVEKDDAIVASSPEEEVEEPTSDPEPVADNEAVPSFAIYDGYDLYGNDVGNVQANDFAQCLEACAKDDQCIALTFNADPRYRKVENCFLKDGVGRVDAYEQAISGVFTMSDDDMELQVEGKPVSPTDVLTKDDFEE